MFDRNVKSECILIKLSPLLLECICESITKFDEKILFDSGVINLQMPITEYICSSTALLIAVTCLEVMLC